MQRKTEFLSSFPLSNRGNCSANAAEQIADLEKDEQTKAFEAAIAKGPKKKKVIRTTEPKPSKPPYQGGRLSPTQIAEYEARINAPSSYPEDLPLPVHPKAHLTAHIQEAITDLKKHEPRIGELSRRWCYQEVWCLTQRIQSYSPGYGKPADQVVDIHPRWVQWARSVAGKVRAREQIILYTPQKLRSAPKERKFSELGFEKLLKEWQRLVKRGLKEMLFAPDQESRILEATEQTILTYFEERRTAHVRLTPSPIGEPQQTANGSPSLNKEQ